MRPYDRVKRALDLLGSLLALAVLWPVLVVVAVLVRVKLGSPVLFVQERPGKDGRIFRLRKFRTMLPADATHHTDAERLTAFGRLLRSTSLDELPSLLNILVGDMSFVGPRPLLVEYLPLYSPTQARRHEVRPGLTGLAQASGRNALDWPRRLALDVEYVEHRSLVLDARILLATVGKVLRREGIAAAGEATVSKFTGEQEGRA